MTTQPIDELVGGFAEHRDGNPVDLVIRPADEELEDDDG